MWCDMLIKGIYRHYKGGRYRVLAVARHHETGQPYVVYQSLERGSVNVREFENWSDDVELKDGNFAPRFALEQPEIITIQHRHDSDEDSL